MSELLGQLRERDTAIRSHHEFRTGRSMPKPMTLEGMAADRIAELEAALRGADNRLRDHGDTTLHPVRERIWRLIGEPTI